MEQFVIVQLIALWLAVFSLFAWVIRLSKLSVLLTPAAKPPTTLRRGEEAPDFLAYALEGRPVTQREYDGRATLFLFLRPDCAPCHDAIPALRRLHPRASSAGVEMVLVSDTSRHATREFVARHSIPFRVLISDAEDSTLAHLYNPDGSTPFYCYFDPRGIVRSSGIIGLEEWQQLVEAW